MQYSLVSVDPGVHTAFAYWRNETLVKMETIHLKGVNDAHLLADLQARMPTTGTLYARCVIEDIMLYTGSAKSMASGARGNLTTLAKIAGAVGFEMTRRFQAKVEFVTPQAWKGQLKYKQLRNILIQKFGYTAKNDHEASAYGIGLWAMGKF